MIKISDLRSDLSFGSRITGVTYEALADTAVREDLNRLFEARGLLVFEDMEPSGKMHVALSNVFGELKDHPVPSVARVDADTMPGVIDMRHDPETAGIVEIDGKQLSQWLPWHFDHCYNNELNRAGVLRAVTIPPEGGLTGFADGIQIYEDLPEDLRQRIAAHKVVYTLDLLYQHMRFGKPATFRELRVPQSAYDATAYAANLPRAIHPAVWTRKTGEKVLHVSPWMAVGLEGHEDPQGDALLEEVCQTIAKTARPYFHQWQPTDMLIWDNWRMLHCVSGTAPQNPRRMQRTTIKGDYGLGYFENAGKGAAILEMTV
jgi:taurine dioxygenase